MNTFIENNNTFWGQYADIEQPHPSIKKNRTLILEPVKEEEDEEAENGKEDKEEDKEINDCCNYNRILYYQLCVIIFTIFTIFMV